MILLLPLRHFRCSQGFPPTKQRRHERNWSFTRDILRNPEEHHRACLLRPFSTLLQELHDFSSRFFRHIQVNLGVEAITPYSCLCFVQSRYLFESTLLQPWERFLLFLQLFVFPRFILHFLNAFVTLPVLLPSISPLSFFGPTTSQLLLLCSGSVLLLSLLGDFVPESSASVRTLNHLRHCLLCNPSFFYHLPFSFL